jgi:Flp pilus assembly protein TadD
VSLLMDALKRAEQANQTGQSSVQPKEASHLVLEPVVSGSSQSTDPPLDPSSAATALPELPKLEVLDDEFLAHAKQPHLTSKPATATRAAPPIAPNQRSHPPAGGIASGTKPVAADAATERDAVRNAFAIKQVTRPSRSFFLNVGIATAIASAVIGTYFWLQLTPKPGIALKLPVVSGFSQTSPSTVATTTSAPIAFAQPAPPVKAARAPSEEAARPTPRPIEQSHPRITAGMEPILFAKSRPKAEPTAANDGYLAFQAGNVAAAKLAYMRLLDNDPRSLDALHGLAAIALREGRSEDAETTYLRILDIDPRDAAANAGLISVRNQGDPVANESRIKNLLASQPDMHVLSFSLGNLYARQNRWSEAQQAYFRAYRADGENPDYLFNLAVSLDQLHQPKLAMHYYGQALKAAESRPAAFDHNQVLSRLRDLQR